MSRILTRITPFLIPAYAAIKTAALLILIFTGLSLANEETPWDRKAPFEQAVISYTIQGAETGSETLYIRNYGLEQASYHRTSSTLSGTLTETNTVEITTPNWIYTYDLISETGEKTVNPTRFLIEAYRSLSPEEQKTVWANAKKVGPSILEDISSAMEQNADMILGFSCDRTRMTETTVYTLHGTDIVLKTEGSIMNQAYSMTATAIEKIPVPDKVFKHPRNIMPELVTESETMAREMAMQVMEVLKGNP
ncbi:MAG: hypothetical protein V1793_07890 [Pseudomonadota bacterium]